MTKLINNRYEIEKKVDNGEIEDVFLVIDKKDDSR